MYLNENKYICKVKLGKYKLFVINIFCMCFVSDSVTQGKEG